MTNMEFIPRLKNAAKSRRSSEVSLKVEDRPNKRCDPPIPQVVAEYYGLNLIISPGLIRTRSYSTEADTSLSWSANWFAPCSR